MFRFCQQLMMGLKLRVRNVEAVVCGAIVLCYLKYILALCPPYYPYKYKQYINKTYKHIHNMRLLTRNARMY